MIQLMGTDRNILIITGIALGLTLFPLASLAQELQNIDCHFMRSDTGYAFRGSFFIDGDPDCLLALCFEYEHIRELAKDARSVILLDQGADWNRVSYTYRKYLLFQNESIWHRIRDPENHRVDFTLVSSENNYDVMPELTASSGYYQVISGAGGARLEYYQQCRVNAQSISEFYLNQAEKDAVRFISDFADYSEEHCGSRDTVGGY